MAKSRPAVQVGLEAVVQRSLTWPGNSASVCFFDGSQRTRDHVAEVAEQWALATKSVLKLDFGPSGARRTCDWSNPSDIRVSFNGVGYWSYVGTQAKLINAYKQTLNLAGMDTITSFTTQEDGVILHEFGHAIGFEHEHQSPQSGCEEEFNWNYLYTALGWPRDDVDRNMRRLDISSSKTLLLTTAFDSKSVMLYSLSPEAFKDPNAAKCYIPRSNTKISDLDARAAEIVYPAAAPAASVPPPAAQPGGQAPLAMDARQLVKQLRQLTNK
jgi:hypothetical protein